MNTQSSEIIAAALLRIHKETQRAEFNALTPEQQAIRRQHDVVEKWMRKADRARYNAITEAASAARYDKEASIAKDRLNGLINQLNKNEVTP